MHTKLMVKLIDVEAPRQPDPEKLASADNETLLSMVSITIILLLICFQKNSELQQENSAMATEIQELFRVIFVLEFLYTCFRKMSNCKATVIVSV